MVPVRAFAVALLLALAVLAAPGSAEAAGAGSPAAAGPNVEGHWTGAKLRCQKEEGKLVRCGTPAPFEITFVAGGVGTTPDEYLPKEFAWRFLSPKEIGIAPKAGGEEVKLFAVEQEEADILTFQAYVFLPTIDPNAPAESRYIHYVFDVSRTE